MSTSIHITFNSSTHYGRVGTDSFVVDFNKPLFPGLDDVIVRAEDLERRHAAGDVPSPQRAGPKVVDLALICRLGTSAAAQGAKNTLLAAWAPITAGSTVPLVIVMDSITYTMAGLPAAPKAVEVDMSLVYRGVIRVLCSFKVPSGTVTIT